MHLLYTVVYTVVKFDTQEQILRDRRGLPSLRKVPAMLKIVHCSGINLDIFLHEKRNGKIWHGSGVHMWVNKNFSLEEYNLEGQKVLGPAPADHYLSEHYGDWRKVVKDFSCTTGTDNLAFVPNLYTISILLKRYIYFSSSHPEYAFKILSKLSNQGYICVKDGKPKLASGFV